jgi:Zn-dependent protease/CBS domain-containing protein
VKYSWRIGRLFGIGIFLHATFPLMVLWVAWRYYDQNGLMSEAFEGVVFILAVFAIVVMHELGHALTARRFGIATRDIILLPIGGVARLERMPEDPKQELLIAVAGPAVNVVLAAIFLAIAVLLGDPDPGSISGSVGLAGSFVDNMIWVNVALIAFNALPAFPMDGGRVLRALLAMRFDYARATEIAATVGKGFAVLFGVAGVLVLQNPLLVVIAFFVWLGASGEASQARFRHDVAGARAAAVLIRDMVILAPDDPLEIGIERVLAGFQQDFPVVEGGVLVGILTREDLLRALNTEGRSGNVRDAMRTEFPVVSLEDGIEHTFTMLQASGLRTIPVVSNGALIGVVTTENIAEYLMLRSALKGQQPLAVEPVTRS